MLLDYMDTIRRLNNALREKGRSKEWLYANILLVGESEEDFDSLLEELRGNGKVHNQYGYIHLITPESEARRQQGTKKNKVEEANPWAWYAWLPESIDFRNDIRKTFTKDDAKVFRALAAIITNERTPRIGTRTVGPITEEEGRYIVKVNEALLTFKQNMKDG